MKRTALLALAFAASALLSGCEGKRIAELGGISGHAEFRADGVYLRLNLLTSSGAHLLWTSDNFSGGGVLHESELDTRIQVYSLKDGQRNETVFSGRLRSLRWNAARVNSFRSLVGVIPSALTELDPEADGPTGEIDATLITPNQGEFETTVYDAQIYPASLFLD